MSITPDEVKLLVKLVTAEYGEHAVAHVDAYVNSLRKADDKASASLWSKVLAMLCHENAPTPNHDQKDRYNGHYEKLHQNCAVP